MRTLFRYLLWILIAAIPLQGSAAAVMMYGAASSAPVAMPMTVGQHHDHCADTGRGQGVPAATQAASMHGDSAQGAAALGADTHAAGEHSKCSHCASCCVGAVAPPSLPSLLLPSSFSTVTGSAPEPAMTAYIPATLERPPRLA